MWCQIHILMDAPFSCNNLCCCALLMSIKPKRKFSCHYSSAAASFLMMNCFVSTALCVFITTEHDVAVIMKANWIITVMDTWVVNREISNDWIIFLFISLNFVVFFFVSNMKKIMKKFDLKTPGWFSWIAMVMKEKKLPRLIFLTNVKSVSFF